MPDLSFLVIAYAVIWLAVLAYLGWIALRMRGVRAELETVRDLVEHREHSDQAQ
ncbi:MAG: CcmD family protein [Ktedonobacterales bacterium]